MQILKLRWKNFNSYGNKWNEIDLSTSDSGFYIIIGNNGAGKSTISDVLKFALYGKVNNKKLKDIPNRLNKACEVEVTLKSNGRNVIIKRGLEPNYFKVDVEGLDAIDKQAGKLNIQEFLENEIYGMPYYVFNNIISLSINDFKSFIKMTPSDKREIIDKIIGLSIINEMYEALKSDMRQIIDTDNKLVIQNNILNEQLERTTKQLEDLSKKLIESTSEKQEEINQKIEALNKLKMKFKKQFDEQSEIIKKFTDRISDSKHLIQEAKFQLRTINSKLKLYNNDKCPECGSDLHTPWHEHKLEVYHKEKERWDSRILLLEDLIKNETMQKEIIENKHTEIKKKINKIDTNNAILYDHLSKIQDSNYIDEQTTSMKSLINDTNNQLEIIKEEKKKVENKLQFYKIIEEALSDHGIKQLAIRTILPTINTNIYQLMKELNLNFKLSFTEDWSSVITHLGQEINPVTLSTGENKKLDIAVILAIIKLMKFKFPGLNILFLDEVMSSLDADSSYHILKILSRTCKELNLHIFIINHTAIDNSQFDYKIFVEKTNGFSNITINKLE